MARFVLRAVGVAAFPTSDMHPQTIFAKTSKGVLAAKNRSTRLPAALDVVFLAVNGRSSVSTLRQTLRMDESSLLPALHRLVVDGYIRIFYEPREAEQSPPVSADHDLDFT